MTAAQSAVVRRNATLHNMVALLREQHAVKLDLVLPPSALRSTGGAWEVAGAGEPVLGPVGVTTGPGRFVPTGTCDAGIADKLGIPTAYLRRLREDHLPLYDANINGWLDHDPTRQFLLRLLRGADGKGVARAVLSSRYRFVDNLDVMLAVLDGIRSTGAEVRVGRCDLTERRMYVQISSPAVAAHAQRLLAGYVSPFTGARGTDNPLVFAGFVLSNSETGHGSYSIVPRLIVQVCDNGLTITKDAMREVHLGGRLDPGVVRWSEGTQRAAVDLITRQAADAAGTFLSPDYLHRTLAGIEEDAGVPMHDVPATLKYVATQLRFTDDQQTAILDHFITGGQRTTGGILQAVTSAAQLQDDADVSYDMERVALRAMTLAAAHQK